MKNLQIIKGAGSLVEKIDKTGDRTVDNYNDQYNNYLASVFEPYETKSIKHIDDAELKAYFNTQGFTELILKTTEGCNLRCKYCVYSDYYQYSPGYGSEKMDERVAYKATNYYLDHIIFQSTFFKTKRPYIAFYGGEPLLNFELIESVIKHVEQKYPELKVYYTITTNGLLLKDTHISDFLKQHNVIICLSIDGYPDNHDRNRVTHEGKHTYCKIMEIIENNYRDYPLIYSLCCIDYRTDLIKLYDFYMKNDRISGGILPHLLRITPISDVDTTYYEQFSSKERETFLTRFSMLEKEYVSLAKKDKHNWFLDLLIGQELLRLYDRPKFMKTYGFYYMNGCCIPGDKIYALPDGAFSVCEKVGSKDFLIGDIEKGLDLKAIQDAIRAMNTMTRNMCGDCDFSAICSLCYSHCVSKQKLGFSKEYCAIRQKGFYHKFALIQEILSENPSFFEKRIKEVALKNDIDSQAEDNIPIIDF